ncbi:hypothetical protein FB451DRAFT_311791 [Mycena latifolia]|nr:hypothetical protein FB451DRAFT_311791 [Mycena latifolia]
MIPKQENLRLGFSANSGWCPPISRWTLCPTCTGWIPLGTKRCLTGSGRGPWTFDPSLSSSVFLNVSEQAVNLSIIQQARHLENMTHLGLVTHVAYFDIILIYPEHLLAPDEPVLRLDRSTSQFHRYYAGSDGHLHRDAPDGERLPPFPPNREKANAAQHLNPFLVALSCHDRLKSHFAELAKQGRPASDSPHLELYEALERLVEELWEPLTPPEGHPGSDGGDTIGGGAEDFTTDPVVDGAAGDMGKQYAESTPVAQVPVDVPEPSREVQEQLDLMASMTTPERVAYGHTLFFRPIEDWD